MVEAREAVAIHSELAGRLELLLAKSVELVASPAELAREFPVSVLAVSDLAVPALAASRLPVVCLVEADRRMGQFLLADQRTDHVAEAFRREVLIVVADHRTDLEAARAFFQQVDRQTDLPVGAYLQTDLQDHQMGPGSEKCLVYWVPYSPGYTTDTCNELKAVVRMWEFDKAKLVPELEARKSEPRRLAGMLVEPFVRCAFVATSAPPSCAEFQRRHVVPQHRIGSGLVAEHSRPD